MTLEEHIERLTGMWAEKQQWMVGEYLEFLRDLSRRRAQDAKRDAVLEALKYSTKMLSDLQFHLEKVEPQATEGRKYMALQIAKNFRLMHDYEAATKDESR